MYGGVRFEIQPTGSGSGVDARDAERVARELDLRGAEQGARRFGQRSEAVDGLRLEVVEGVEGARVGDALVQDQPHVDIRQVVVRNQRLYVQVHFGTAAQRGERLVHVGDAPGAYRLHGALEHFHVEGKADRFDLPGLILAEQFAGAADLEVVGGQREPDAEFARRLDGVEALARVAGQRALVGRHQVRVSLVVGAPHTAAQLVQLGEAELVGAVDEDRVGVRDVDAVLDDRGAHEQVAAAVVEVGHRSLERALVHLSVPHADARLGDQRPQFVGGAVDAGDLVVDEEHLAAAREFPGDGFAHDVVALRDDEGLDRQPLGGGCGDDGEFAQAAEREIQGARNGGGGERKHVHLRAQGPQALLLAHAEAMLFVDDDQAQVVEGDAGAEQAVGTDHDVHLAGRQAVGDRGDLAVRAHAGHGLDVHRPVGEAVAEGLVVLLREERCRRQHGDLPAGRHGHEGGAHGDLGLAETHVAADQPVGGPLRTEVLDDGVDGGLLVGGGLEREPVAETGVLVVRATEGRSRTGRAPRVDVEQFRRDVVRLARCASLGLFPLVRSEAVQRGVFGVGARVARDEMERGHRYVELGLLRVLEGQELLRMAVDVERLEALVAADAVIDVHDRRTDGELRQVADHQIGVDAARRRARGDVVVAAAEDLRLGDDGEPGQPGAAFDVGDRRRKGDALVEELLEGRHRGGPQARPGEELLEVLGASGGLRREQHGNRAVLEEAAQQPRFVPSAVARGDFRQGTAVEADAVAVQRPVGVDLDAWVGLEHVTQLRARQVQRTWLEDGPLDVVAQRLVTAVQFVLEAGGLGHRVRVEDDDGRFRQEVEEGRRLLEEERQVVLDARMRDAATDVLVHGTAAHIDVERPVPAVAEARDPFGVEGHFAGRQHAHRLDALCGALRVRIEGAQGLDAVVEQVDAQRGAGAHGEDVHQGAAHGILAALPDGAHVLVAGTVQARALFVDGEALAGAQGERVCIHEGSGREPLHERANRGDEHAVRDVAQLVEGGQAIGNDVLVGREVVVGERLPVRERAHRHLAGPVEVDLVAHALRVLGVAGCVEYEGTGFRREPRRAEAGATAEDCLPVVYDVADRCLDPHLGGCHRGAVWGGNGPRILSQRRRPGGRRRVGDG